MILPKLEGGDLVEVKMLRLGLELLQQDAKRFQKSKRTKIELILIFSWPGTCLG